MSVGVRFVQDNSDIGWASNNFKEDTYKFLELAS